MQASHSQDTPLPDSPAASIGQHIRWQAALALVGEFFPGYRVTRAGSVLGLAYGFLVGFLGGWSFGVLRNAAVLLALGPGPSPGAERNLTRALLRAI